MNLYRINNNSETSYEGNFNDVVTEVNSSEKTNLHPAMFDVENLSMTQNKLREGLRNVIAKKFNNDINTFAEWLECPAEDLHAFLDGTAPLERDRLRMCHDPAAGSGRYVQIGGHPEISFNGDYCTHNHYYGADQEASALLKELVKKLTGGY